MDRKERFLPGYFIGSLVFIVAFPLGMYMASSLIDIHLAIGLVPNRMAGIVIAVIALAAGATFTAWSLVVQYRIGKGGPLEGMGMAVSPKTKRLVTGGPYRYTRNPMVFGTCMYYYAVSFLLNSPASLAAALLFTACILIYVKAVEEKRLVSEFGNDYKEYRRMVSMFIPLPPGR